MNVVKLGNRDTRKQMMHQHLTRVDNLKTPEQLIDERMNVVHPWLRFVGDEAVIDVEQLRWSRQ